MDQQTDSPKLLTPGDAAKQLGLKPRTLRAHADKGHLTVVRLDGGHRRYLEAEIHAIVSGRAS